MTGSPVTINLNLLDTRPLGATPHIVGNYSPRCHPHPLCSQKVVGAQPGDSKLQSKLKVPICSSTSSSFINSGRMLGGMVVCTAAACTEYMSNLFTWLIQMVEMVEMVVDIFQTELQTSDLSRLISVFNQVQWERRKRQNGQSSYSNLSLENHETVQTTKKAQRSDGMQRVQHQPILLPATGRWPAYIHIFV